MEYSLWLWYQSAELAFGLGLSSPTGKSQATELCVPSTNGVIGVFIRLRSLGRLCPRCGVGTYTHRLQYAIECEYGRHFHWGVHLADALY